MAIQKHFQLSLADDDYTQPVLFFCNTTITSNLAVEP